MTMNIEQPAPVPEAHKQQEPVAVVKALPMGHNQTDMHYAECQHLPVGTLLYTSPPASKPLTDAHIGAVAADIWGSVLIAPQSYQAFARAIEAKLRELNEHREKNA